MSEEMLDLTAAEREELIEALQYPTKWRDRGMPTEQVVERATDSHEAAQVVDDYLLPVISSILAARCAELEAEIHRLHVSEHDAALDGHENASERDDALAECVMLREQLRLQTDRAAALRATLDRVTALADEWEREAKSWTEQAEACYEGTESRSKRLALASKYSTQAAKIRAAIDGPGDSTARRAALTPEGKP